MSPDWGSLPLLPLKCVLEHLSLEDALAATSVCRHWRSAILLYESHKDILHLYANQLEKSLFLTRIFKKHSQRLHIHIDCKEQELDKFINTVLPQFFDTLNLQEIQFIGPNYAKNCNVQVVKLKRIITESLIFKHMHCLRQLALLGCEINTVYNDNERYTNKKLEYYTRPLSFDNVPSPANTVLSRCNSNLMVFSKLQHIILDYDQISTCALITLSRLPQFSHLTMAIPAHTRNLTPVEWSQLQAFYPNRLSVSIVLFGEMTQMMCNEIISEVLIEDLMLVSFKALFCGAVFLHLLMHIVSAYKSTIRELVWADEPFRPTPRLLTPLFTTCNVNPLIVMCWQCVQLQRLVIHGYYISQYDIIGMVRLREGLEHLELSCVFERAAYVKHDGESLHRLCIRHAPPLHRETDYIQEVNKFTRRRWAPTPWEQLHPALREHSTPELRSHYVLQEINKTHGT